MVKKSEKKLAYDKNLYFVSKEGYATAMNKKTKTKSKVPGIPKITRESGFLYYVKPNATIGRSRMKRKKR